MERLWKVAFTADLPNTIAVGFSHMTTLLCVCCRLSFIHCCNGVSVRAWVTLTPLLIWSVLQHHFCLLTVIPVWYPKVLWVSFRDVARSASKPANAAKIRLRLLREIYSLRSLSIFPCCSYKILRKRIVADVSQSDGKSYGLENTCATYIYLEEMWMFHPFWKKKSVKSHFWKNFLWNTLIITVIKIFHKKFSS